MEINVAALKMKILELMGEQLEHLQNEADKSSSYDYAETCNENANELILGMAKIIDKEIDITIPAVQHAKEQIAEWNAAK